jgi:dephospho-CoA kinase
MANKVVALVGMCGAGKSVVTEWFKERGYAPVHFGDATMEEMARRGLETNEVNEKIVREELRAAHGMAAYAIVNLPRIEKALVAGHVVLDGLYSWSEYKILNEKFADALQVLAIFTPRDLRYKRLAEREIRPLTQEQSRSRDHSEIENIEKGGPIAMADYTVVNDGDVDYLHGQLEKTGL